MYLSHTFETAKTAAKNDWFNNEYREYFLNSSQNNIQKFRLLPEIHERFPICVSQSGFAKCSVWEFVRHLYHTNPQCFDTQMKLKHYRLFDQKEHEEDFVFLPSYIAAPIALDLPDNCIFMFQLEGHDIVLQKDFSVSYGNANGSSATTMYNLFFETDEVKALFLQHFIAFVHAHKNKQLSLMFFTNTKKDWIMHTLKVAPTWESYFISDEIRAKITNKLDTFVSKEYKDRCVKFGKPYKLNILLYGVPGAGKTTLIKLLARLYRSHLYLLSLSKEMTDSTLNELYKNIDSDKAMIALEDVDSFFNKRESLNCNISFSSLINVLDGVQNAGRGHITFLTANHVENLDPALIRPGRIDLIIKFDYPQRPEVFAAFKALANHNNKTEQQIEDDFNKWYKHVRNLQIPMSGITDYLFEHADDYLENVQDLIDNTKHLKDMLTSNTQTKMYM